MTSIEDRLRRTYDALTLIASACNTNDVGDTNDIVEAVARLAANVRGDIYWMQQLPGIVMTLPSPDCDEIETQFGVCGGDEMTAHIEAVVTGALDAKGDRMSNRLARVAR